ncbi:MAG: MoaD/ThiS family protein [Dehalococcoidales bacterium]
MPKCTVDFFGLPVNITELKVEIELKEDAKLKDIIAALRSNVPALEGKIIVPGEDRMVDGYTFNIQGRFYVDGIDGDKNLQLKDGDHIALLTIPVGG